MRAVRSTIEVCVAISALVGALAGCSDRYVSSEDSGGEDATDGAVAGTDTDADSGTEQGDTNPDGGTDTGGRDDTDVGPNTCTPEGDGVVQREEVPLEPGLRATFRVAEDVQVDTSGTSSGDGRTWDFSGSYSGDHSEAVEFRPVAGTWFAAEFPKAEYATRLAGDSEALGVFRATDDALLLLGIVSPTDGSRTTEITYDPPVKILDFPLKPSKTWKTETTASGTHKTWSPFAPITYTETYTNQVDAQGTVATPYGRFQALRIRTVMERSGAVAGVPFDTIRTFSFVAECFGTVATVRSQSNETKTEFEDAAELRRLAK